MTLERARSHDGWRARRPRPLAAIASRAIKKFRVSATLRMTDAPPPRGLGSPNSHFYRPKCRSAHRRGQRNRSGQAAALHVAVAVRWSSADRGLRT